MVKKILFFVFNDAFNTFYLRLYGVGHMVKDLSARKETHCRHYMRYSFQLAASDNLYAPSNRQDSTYHGLYYTSCRALAGTRNSSVGLLRGIGFGITDTGRSQTDRLSVAHYVFYDTSCRIRYLRLLVLLVKYYKNQVLNRVVSVRWRSKSNLQPPLYNGNKAMYRLS